MKWYAKSFSMVSIRVRHCTPRLNYIDKDAAKQHRLHGVVAQ